MYALLIDPRYARVDSGSFLCVFFLLIFLSSPTVSLLDLPNGQQFRPESKNTQHSNPRAGSRATKHMLQIQGTNKSITTLPAAVRARARQNTCTLRSFAKPNTPCRCCSGLPRFDVGDRDADGVRVAVAGHAGAAAEHRLAEHGLAETRTIPPRLRSEVMNRPVKGSLRDSTKRSL